MEKLFINTVFTKSILEQVKKPELGKEYIQFSIIPALNHQMEFFLNGLNWKDGQFPFKKKIEDGSETWQFEFLIMTPDELELIKSNERLKGRRSADEAKW